MVHGPTDHRSQVSRMYAGYTTGASATALRRRKFVTACKLKFSLKSPLCDHRTCEKHLTLGWANTGTGHTRWSIWCRRRRVWRASGPCRSNPSWSTPCRHSRGLWGTNHRQTLIDEPEIAGGQFASDRHVAIRAGVHGANRVCYVVWAGGTWLGTGRWCYRQRASG